MQARLLSPNCRLRIFGQRWRYKPQRELHQCKLFLLLVLYSNWNLEMLVFVAGGKPENPEKNPWSRARTRLQWWDESTSIICGLHEEVIIFISTIEVNRPFFVHSKMLKKHY